MRAIDLYDGCYILSIYMMYDIHAIDLWRCMICYLSMMRSALYILFMVLYTTCYLSMKWTFYRSMTLSIEDTYVDKRSSTTVLLTLWTIVLGCYTRDNIVAPRDTLLCVLSIYMMNAIYSIDLYDVRYTCYRSVTMHDMLSIYDAISSSLWCCTCYLSMRWVIYILSIDASIDRRCVCR